MLLASVPAIREKLDLTWAAGLFDGEGYAGVIPHSEQANSRVPVMSLSMTCFEAVHKFHAIFGLGSLFKEAPRQEHHKPALRWQARHRHALYVAERLIPFSVVKKDALLAIVQHYVAYEAPECWFKPGQVGATAKLTEDDVRAIRKSSAPGKELAAKYGVGVVAISNVRTRKTWAHVKD